VIGRLVRLTQRIWILASVAMAVALVGVIAAVFGWWWLCIAAVTALQLGILLMLLLGVISDSARRLDALSARVMAAIETERLSASDRHREIVELLERKIEPSDAHSQAEAEPSIPTPSHQGPA
jgi:divalent metal cation (Fe/Co/Zn/Cd) transporter